MFVVSYRRNEYGTRTVRTFSAFASALKFFLEKFHEERFDLRLTVREDVRCDREEVAVDDC